MATCKGCGARIVWIGMLGGKSMPCDPDPVTYWEKAKAKGKVVTQTSVGNVCKLAQSGEVDVAFVYTSDVYRFGGVKIVGTVAGDTHKNIVYPGAVCTQSKYQEEAQAFLDWCLTDPEALKIWQKWGFELA